jgi:hypothetical protein
MSADLQQVKGPRPMIWQDWISAGRVAEDLCEGWRLHLKECEFRFNPRRDNLYQLLPKEVHNQPA